MSKPPTDPETILGVRFVPCRECQRLIGPSQQRAGGVLVDECPVCRDYARLLRQVAAKLKRAGEKRRHHMRLAEQAREHQSALCKQQAALLARRDAYLASVAQELGLGRAA